MLGAGAAAGLAACGAGLVCGLLTVGGMTGGGGEEMLDTLIGVLPLMSMLMWKMMIYILCGTKYRWRAVKLESRPIKLCVAKQNRRWVSLSRWRILLILILSCRSMCAAAGGGPLGIDSELPLDTNGIWARRYQTGIENGVIVVELAGALWFGNADKLGHTFWQDIDSTAVSGVSVGFQTRF